MTEEINFDFDRENRLGFDEAVFAERKTNDQLAHIVEMASNESRRLLFTRLSQIQVDSLPRGLKEMISYHAPSLTATMGRRLELSEPKVAVVAGGSSDTPVCYEAIKTLEYYGIGTRSYFDVGVAGLSRLLSKIDDIRSFPVVLSVAGMEGALHSVLGGLVPGVVIAVPTSVGYGVSAGGVASLSSALASCAPGLLITNIDNGYGAACAAIRALNIETRNNKKGRS